MDLQKRLRNECIDRISDLPDPILSKILSYLPVKDVVATSILSTRWKPLFPSHVPLTRLDFDDSYRFRAPRKNDSHHFLSSEFKKFVDKLLNVTLRDVSRVGMVVVNTENKYRDGILASWVCAALRLNLQHLRLMLYWSDSIALFDSLHGCSTLVELELGKCFYLHLPKEFILPNLKKLSLYELELYKDVDAFKELLDGCPVLNDLRITNCDFGFPVNLHIQHHNINKLFLDSFNISRVVIDAPKLGAIVFKGNAIGNYVLRNTKALYSVCIDFQNLRRETCWVNRIYSEDRLAQLVKACSSTARLCLMGNLAMYLHRSSVPLPIFQNLTCLALGHMGNYGWTMLARFLKSAPNLTILSFEEELDFKGTYAGFNSLLSSLPVCELNIKKIEIWEFKWTRKEIKLIEYFLEKGRVLQELIVHCLPCENENRLKKISMLPKYS